MAALFTGFQPWRVQSWSSDRAVLDEPVHHPAGGAEEARATAPPPSAPTTGSETQFGYAQGFDLFQLPAGGQARRGATWRSSRAGRDFVWIHILPPHAPYIRRDPLLDRLPEIAAGPAAAGPPLDLEPYYDPAVPLPAEQERMFRAMYRSNAA